MFRTLALAPVALPILAADALKDRPIITDIIPLPQLANVGDYMAIINVGDHKLVVYPNG